MAFSFPVLARIRLPLAGDLVEAVVCGAVHGTVHLFARAVARWIVGVTMLLQDRSRARVLQHRADQLIRGIVAELIYPATH